MVNPNNSTVSRIPFVTFGVRLPAPTLRTVQVYNYSREVDPYTHCCDMYSECKIIFLVCCIWLHCWCAICYKSRNCRMWSLRCAVTAVGGHWRCQLQAQREVGCDAVGCSLFVPLELLGWYLVSIRRAQWCPIGQKYLECWSSSMPS